MNILWIDNISILHQKSTQYRHNPQDHNWLKISCNVVNNAITYLNQESSSKNRTHNFSNHWYNIATRNIQKAEWKHYKNLTKVELLWKFDFVLIEYLYKKFIFKGRKCNAGWN